MSNLFNSTFETSLRVLLTLYIQESEMSLDRIVATDFITIYAAEFGLGQSNLHGVNEFSFSEYAFRRDIVAEAIRELLVCKELRLRASSDGFLYQITDKGSSICDEMTTQYASEYMNTSYKIKATLADKSTLDIIEMINNKAQETKERRH